MRNNIFIGIFLLCLCLIISVACDSGKNENPEPVGGNPSNREEMLVFYADEIIIPSYANFKVKMDTLVNKSKKFTDNPDNTTLTVFRDAWADAYIEWQKVELFDVGPAYDHALRSFFNIYPVTESTINNNIAIIAGGGKPNLESFASYSAQGFPALDYLINGLGVTDNDILVYYTTASDSAHRIAYLKSIINSMSIKSNQVYAEWTGSYRNTFVSKTSMDMNESTSLLVNSYVLNYEKYIRSGKIGIPSGAMIGGVISPSKVEAYYKKDISLILAKTAHQASVDLFNGKSVKTGNNGASLKTYLNSIGAKDSQTGSALTDIINTQFTLANSKLDLLDDNLSQEVQTDNQKMIEAYAAMQKAVRMLKVDMTSAMGVTITYTDNDGD